MRAKGGKADDKHGDKPAKLAMWKLEEFIVNLADRDDYRYLKISLVLEIAGDGKEGGGEGEGNPQEAKARDAVITVLSRKRFADLISEQGKVQLKTELKSELNTVLEGAQVVNIYFSSFAMQ
jgi:flagellar FliL protein